MCVMTLGVRQREPPRETRQFAGLARPEHQVPVVGHDAIREQPYPCPINRLLKDLLEGFIVRIVFEDR